MLLSRNRRRRFDLTANPFPELDIPTGRYELPRRSGDAHLYRLGHPLAMRLVQQAIARLPGPAEVVFDRDGTRPRVGAMDLYRGFAGELLVSKLSVESMDQAEDILLAAAVTSDGRMLPAEVAGKFFSLSALEVRPVVAFPPDARLEAEIDRQQAEEQRKISERNGRLFEEEASKLDSWADDLKVGLEREIKDLDRQLKEARRSASAGLSLEDKVAGQRQVKKLESERNDKRRKLFAAQDEIEQRRDKLIASVEAKLEQRVSLERLLSIRWRVT